MASYYYLISSLPALKTDAQMPFDYKTFLAMCKNVVHEKVYEKLENLSLDSEDGPLVREWGLFYNHLNNELCRQRLIRMGKEPKIAADMDSGIDKTIDAVFKAKNPLEAERILLDSQFDYLDGLVSMHYFDDFVLYGYALKLKLLERQSQFVTENGKTEFKRLFDGIQLQILNI